MARPITARIKINGSRTLVLFVWEMDGPQRVVDLDALYRRPAVLAPFNPSYTRAINFWKLIGLVSLVGGIAASFTWHWWVFLVGGVATFALDRANRESTGNYVRDILKLRPGSIDYL